LPLRRGSAQEQIANALPGSMSKTQQAFHHSLERVMYSLLEGKRAYLIEIQSNIEGILGKRLSLCALSSMIDQ